MKRPFAKRIQITQFNKKIEHKKPSELQTLVLYESYLRKYKVEQSFLPSLSIPIFFFPPFNLKIIYN